MSGRTYKVVSTPLGMKGVFIHEIVNGEVGAEFLHLPEGTPPHTGFDVVVAVQRAYRQGLADAIEIGRDHPGHRLVDHPAGLWCHNCRMAI